MSKYEFTFGPSVGPARPAVGGFPYPSRTVEQLDEEYEDLWEKCLESERGRGKWS